MPKGVHYGHVLTSKVADCISPRQLWDILKRRNNTIRAQQGRAAESTRPMQWLQRAWCKQFSKEFLSARATDPLRLQCALWAHLRLLYWQICANVWPMCYITPSVHVRAYIQD
jgi:hypothetical protein